MTDKELIEWIKGVKAGRDMPLDTGTRVLRLIQILINKAYTDNTLHLNKPRKA